MSHPVEDFLSFEGTIEDLKNAPYFLNVREESTETGKKVWVIDYDQINSPRFNNLVDSCRGIVVCQETLKVVCQTFRRFYNVGEDARTENEFDWDNSFCLSKEDGPWEFVKYPSDKKKIEVYEGLLKDLARNVDFHNDKNVSDLLRNISRWSYAHRCGNGELTEEEQYDTIVKEFHRLREIGRYDTIKRNASDQTNLK